MISVFFFFFKKITDSFYLHDFSIPTHVQVGYLDVFMRDAKLVEEQEEEEEEPEQELSLMWKCTLTDTTWCAPCPILFWMLNIHIDTMSPASHITITIHHHRESGRSQNRPWSKTHPPPGHPHGDLC